MNRRLGFTVVEMVVVIATLVIIAAITVVSYGSWETRMIETQLKNDLTQASSAMEDARTKDGTYPGALPTGFATSDGVTVTVVRATGDHFCLEAESANQPGNKWTAENDTDAKAGGCPSLRFTAVDAGNAHTCAIADSKAFCWGYENYGQTGRGVTSTGGSGYARPVTATLLGSNVTDISAGGSFSCAVGSNKAYCWGLNSEGRLGNNTTTTSNVPVAVSQAVMTGAVDKISAGNSTTCALSGGRPYCWGENFYSALGLGHNTTPILAPTAVVLSSMSLPVSAISNGQYSSCALSLGRAHCWGVYLRFSGTGTWSATTPTRVYPTAVDNSEMNGTVSAIATNSESNSSDNTTSCAASGEEVYCWGKLDSFPYTYNTPSDLDVYFKPRLLPKGEMSGNISKITLGSTYGCAIADGKAYCWGSGLGLGTGSTASKQLPTAVNTDLMKGKVTDISAGTSHTCAIADGEAYCWGTGANYRLGAGDTTSNATVPVKVVPQPGL